MAEPTMHNRCLDEVDVVQRQGTMTKLACAALLAIALAGCSGKDEEKARETASAAAEKAKAAAVTVKDKAASAIDRAKEAGAVAKDKVGEAVEIGDQAFDRLVRKPGILEETDAAVERAKEAVKAAATDAALKAAMVTLATVTKARAAIAKRIDELKAAGTF